MKNKKNKIFKITFTGLMLAIMATLSWTVLGMIPLGIVSATTVFIPVAVGIVCLDDYLYTAVLGIGFGVISLIRALVPQGWLDPFFVLPHISVLPRFLAAMLAHSFYRIFKEMLVKTKLSESRRFVIGSALTGGFVAFFNTFFTIWFLIVFYYDDIFSLLLFKNSDYRTFLSLIILTNMIPEIIIGSMITAMIGKVYYANTVGKSNG